MKKTLLTVVAAILLVTNIQAADLVYNPTLKQVDIYGAEYAKGEIVASETEGALKFVFSGEPAMDIHKKVVQVYCQVWKLKPGNYNLTLQMKSGGGLFRVPVCLNGQTKADEKKSIQLAGYKAPTLSGEWTAVTLPVTVSENMLHGHFIMRVGGIPKGSELYLKPEFIFTVL